MALGKRVLTDEGADPTTTSALGFKWYQAKDTDEENATVVVNGLKTTIRAAERAIEALTPICDADPPR